jgi:hypothetical protein
MRRCLIMEYKRLFNVGLAVAVVVVMMFSAFGGLNQSKAQDEVSKIGLVYLENGESLTLLDNLEIEIVETYDSFQLVKLTPTKIAALERYGVEANLLGDSTTISVSSYNFDTAVGEPTLSLDFTAKESLSGVKGLYIVQFIGPVKEEWLSTLRQTGAEIVGYVPNFAYEVRMTPEICQVVEKFDCTQWIGVYEPAYKISPDLTGNEVTITLNGQDIPEDTLSGIRDMLVIRQEGAVDPDGYIFHGTLKSSEHLATIAAMPNVQFISPYVEPELHDEAGMQISGGYMWYNDPDNNVATPYRTSGTHGSYANQLGWDGAGVTIGIADSGLGSGTTGNAGHVDFNGRVIGGIDLGATVNGWQDEMGHGTHCAGLMAADGFEGTGRTYAGYGPYYAGMGQAHESLIYAQQIFEGVSATGDIPADNGVMLTQGYTGGARVHSNSWGANTAGAYAASDEAYDTHVRDADTVTAGNQQMIVVCSAGNAGSATGTIGSPGNGKNVITVGSTQNYMPDSTSYGNTHTTGAGSNPDLISSFSSRGWSDSGRIKPDVVAPGEWTLSMVSTPPIHVTNGAPVRHRRARRSPVELL